MADNQEIYRYYILFPNHHEGLKAHKYLKEAGIKCTISPTPREASKSCGISLLIDEENVSSARNAIGDHSIKIDGIVKILSKNQNGYRSG